MSDRADPANAPARSAAVRMFGRYQLLRLIGKSARSMVWLAIDGRSRQEVMIAIPRVQPPDEEAAARWHEAMRRAARLSHPNLAPIVDSGEQDRWPYVVHDRALGATLAETMSAKGLEPAEVARWSTEAMQGLAFAHDAGVTHGDIQPFMCVLTEQGGFRLLGLEVACLVAAPLPALGEEVDDNRARHAQRDASERDVLAFGLLIYQALAGQRPLDEPDLGLVIDRMPPVGREIVRLPYSLPRPIPDPLRAIVNRATDRQERHRYRNARTLQRALEGWLKSQSAQGGGPLALLLDRLRTVGVLPALPGAAARAARLALMERERTSELAEVVVEDPALAYELLRIVNSAEIASNGPILTVRRAIAMIGLEGVRRAALALRAWPGPMSPGAADQLARLIERCKRAGRIACLLRPAGYDEEVVYLLTLLQNLGRLVVQYHFPDEAAQIERLMLPAPSSESGRPDEPGLGPEAAAYAVLGVDIEEIGNAVARQSGFSDAMRQMIRRLPESAPVRPSANDDETLRALASCANEIGDLLAQPVRPSPQRLGEALGRIGQRYGRTLGITPQDVVEAVKASGGTRRMADPSPAPAAEVAA